LSSELLRPGERAEANAAYERSVELGTKSGDTWAWNWASWRLKQLEKGE
jgi:hypothetical protein